MDANHQAVKWRYRMKLLNAMVLSLFLLASAVLSKSGGVGPKLTDDQHHQKGLATIQ